MRLSIALLLVFNVLIVNAQKQAKDFYLKRSLKQDGLHFQFTVLEEDKKGVWFYNKQRFYHWYKAQHVISTQGASSGTLLHGNCEAFYPNKQLAQRGRYQKGLKSGEWLYWSEDGVLNRSEHWSNGKFRGIQKWYNEKGEEIESLHIKKWSKERRVADSLIQTRGNKKTIVLFDERSRVVKRENWKHGLLHGKLSTYEDGKLIESKRYKNGEEQLKEGKDTKKPKEEKESFFKRLFKKKNKEEKSPAKEKKTKKEKQKREKKKKEKGEKEE
jgi:antitoxin component YwqK of YwqJK toxin-antitoxin module